MSSALDASRFSSDEWKQVRNYVKSFEDALARMVVTDGPSDLRSFLPPIGDRLRLATLRELLKSDLERRWRRGDTATLEEYLPAFPELGRRDKLDPIFIIDEYRIRHRYGDRPAVTAYRTRFPAQFPELEKAVGVETAAQLDLGTREESPGQISGIAAQALQKSDYTLKKRLGAGSFGEVWRAEAPGGVEVAVKIIRQSINHEEAQRELQSLDLIKQLRHAFLLQTHTYFVKEEQLWIAMELADGSLRDLVKEYKQKGQSGIPLPRLLALFREAAEAIDFLHARNVYHRDIKPDNILFVQGHVKIADFGLAKLRDRQQQSLATATFAGTPAYMAPELWSKKIHRNCDQYSLVATYAELRLGHALYAGRSLVDLMMAHMNELPDLKPLSEPEQQVILRGVAKNPDDRFPTCLAFIDALEDALADELDQLELDSAEHSLEVSPQEEHPTTDPFGSLRLGYSRRRKQSRSANRSSTTVPETVMGPTRRSWLSSVLALGLLTPVIAGAIYWASRPAAWLPEGFEQADERPATLVEGKLLYPKIRTTKNGAEFTFLLLDRVDDRTPPFYLLEDKVANSQFRAAQDDSVYESLKQEIAAGDSRLLPGEWIKGGIADKKDLGIEGKDNYPVLRVSVTEAYCFARWLGGKYGHLPSALEWDKAAGRYDGAPGPFTNRDGKIAINQRGSGPRPLSEMTDDVSMFGLRNMAGNGCEWTSTISVSSDLHVPLRDKEVYQAGLVVLRSTQTWRPTPFSYQEDAVRSPLPMQTQLYLDVSPETGFRVVLHPFVQ